MTDETAADQRALDRGLDAIGPLDALAMAEAAAQLDRLTKPPGSLGRLETLVIELAGITGRADATVERGVVVIAAADHGVTRQGVSAYPSDVTAQMVANFVTGGAAINVLARGAQVELGGRLRHRGLIQGLDRLERAVERPLVRRGLVRHSLGPLRRIGRPATSRWTSSAWAATRWWAIPTRSR